MQVITWKWAHALAKSAVENSDRESLNAQLNIQELVIAGLATRLMEEPAKTLAALEQVKAGVTSGGAEAAAEGAPAPTPPAGNGGLKKQKGRRGTVSAEALEVLKAKVRQLLKQQAKVTRKEICAAAGVTSLSLYNRLIRSMKPELKARGQKAKRVYMLK